jgi:tetratricopeptide (TPR) repeat protein
MMLRRLLLALTLVCTACGSSIACDDARGCAAEARQADEEGRYDDAYTSYTTAMTFAADAPGLYNARGSVAFKAGKMSESIDDFDRAVELEPGSAPYHWQRGISYYYAGRYQDCIDQFDLHRTVNPNDVENTAWHFLCVATLSGIDKARGEFLAVSGDARTPMREVALLFRGDGTVEQLEAAAAADGSDSAYFYGHLYLGLYYETTGDKALAARHIRAAVDDYPADHYMWHVARIHKQLKRY